MIDDKVRIRCPKCARMFRDRSFRLTYMNRPQVSLAMPSIITGNSDVFNFAIQGNLEGE